MNKASALAENHKILFFPHFAISMQQHQDYHIDMLYTLWGMLQLTHCVAHKCAYQFYTQNVPQIR